MFKEVLKIVPQLDNRDLQKMESSLTRRFTRIAKKFGKGLGKALLGGGIAGIALGLIDKILNPLKEVQEAIDRVLKQGDDLVTYAKQFNTTAGKLAKLQAFGQATGLDQSFLIQLLTRFQTRVAEARQDPNLPSAVREYANRTDTADAFFEFIQSLQKLDKGSQTLVQKQIFGEEAAFRTADFLQADFEKLNKFFSKISADDLTTAAQKTGSLSDLQDALAAQRKLKDFIDKSRVINEKVVREQDQRERINLQRETERIKAYDTLSTISETSTRIMALIEKGLIAVTNMVQKLEVIQDFVKKAKSSRIFRGIFGD